MPLQKQNVSINFSKGIDTKPDPFQLQLGAFVDLQNSVFDKLGQLTKRNGFGLKSSLTTTANYITTFQNNLLAVGTNLEAYSSGADTWVSKGTITPIQLNTLPLIRNNINQSYCDSAISSNNLVGTVYSETNGTNTYYKYVVSDAITGQNVITPTTISSDATYGIPRIYFLGGNFLVLYIDIVSANYHLNLIAVNISTLASSNPVLISTSITPFSETINSTTYIRNSFDGVVFDNKLFLAWNGAGASGIKMTTVNTALIVSSAVIVDATITGANISVASDSSNNSVWVTYSKVTSGYVSNCYSLLISAIDLSVLLTETLTYTLSSASKAIVNIATAAQNGKNYIFYEISNPYTYDTATKTNYIMSNTVLVAGTVSTAVVNIKSLGLASKAFILSGNVYYLGIQSSSYQPTYFLISQTSLSSDPQIIAQLAYANGDNYKIYGLPSVNVSGTNASIPYLIKDLVTSVNKDTFESPPAGTQVGGIYTQTGINLVNFNFTFNGQTTAEIGNNLHLTGGFLWSYDGQVAVENNFFLFPENIKVASQASTGGYMIPQEYYYQILYRWTDNQGNVFRSSPSIPLDVTVGAGTNTNTVTLDIPTLRLTHKVDNPVVIEVYRWSAAQQSYYQTTSISSPVLNDTTIDYVTFTDKNADTTIIGNNLIYTTGGVLEDASPPAFSSITLFDTRLWGINSEDQNLLWFSKIIIENTTLEMSPLQTMYVAPNISEKQSTGPMKCLFPMDDKLIIFKKTSLFYVNGTGPDITGSNSQYSEPTFITSPVGCSNQNSIALIPSGLVFQSEKGIWLLDRGLNTSYIGAPVEAYNSATVLSTVVIPNTNQVRFTLDNDITLVYDYFVNQWATFTGIPAVSSIIYNGYHTYLSKPITISPPNIDPYTLPSQIYQETPNVYLDGSSPVEMSFKTGWISMAGLQGYKRAYYLILLGQYYSPHKFSLGIAFDFNPSFVQNPIITPTNVYETFGAGSTWGSSDLFGGTPQIEQWQIGFQNQICQSIQLTFSEIYDATSGIPSGAGLTLSAMDLVVGIKKAYPKNISAKNKTG